MWSCILFRNHHNASSATSTATKATVWWRGTDCRHRKSRERYGHRNIWSVSRKSPFTVLTTTAICRYHWRYLQQCLWILWDRASRYGNTSHRHCSHLFFSRTAAAGTGSNTTTRWIVDGRDGDLSRIWTGLSSPRQQCSSWVPSLRIRWHDVRAMLSGSDCVRAFTITYFDSLRTCLFQQYPSSARSDPESSPSYRHSTTVFTTTTTTTISNCLV